VPQPAVLHPFINCPIPGLYILYYDMPEFPLRKVLQLLQRGTTMFTSFVETCAAYVICLINVLV
jgi:hypothetical protein